LNDCLYFLSIDFSKPFVSRYVLSKLFRKVSPSAYLFLAFFYDTSRIGKSRRETLDSLFKYFSSSGLPTPIRTGRRRSTRAPRKETIKPTDTGRKKPTTNGRSSTTRSSKESIAALSKSEEV
jgi:hypothetical protein